MSGRAREGGDARGQRHAPVVRCLLQVAYDSREDLAAVMDAGLGQGGMFVHTELDLAVGTPLTLSLSCPGLPKPTEIDGTVRWRRPAGGEGARTLRALGIEFLEHQEAVRAEIDAVLAPPPGSIARRGGMFRVLLAEDNAFVSELFRHALTKFQGDLPAYAGHQILVARTGDEAARILESEAVDVAILDHYLPGITGCALLRRMRASEAHRHTPVLVVSAGGAEIRREALASRATLYLQKPVLLTQLLDALRGLLLPREADAG